VKYISGLWQNRAPIEGNEDPMVHDLFMVGNTLFASAYVDPLGPAASRGAVLLLACIRCTQWFDARRILAMAMKYAG
jgi:hypothetical protein